MLQFGLPSSGLAYHSARPRKNYSCKYSVFIRSICDLLRSTLTVYGQAKALQGKQLQTDDYRKPYILLNSEIFRMTLNDLLRSFPLLEAGRWSIFR